MTEHHLRRAVVRTKGLVHDLVQEGPLALDSSVVGHACPGCARPFQPGDYITYVPLGPGIDPDSRQRARQGRWYAAVATVLHYGCATGKRVGPPKKVGRRAA